MKKLYEYNIRFYSGKSGKLIKIQQSAFNFDDAKKRIRAKYPSAGKFKLLKRSGYPHKIG